MGEAIGQVLSLGVGVALSPMAIIGVVLMLSTPRGRSNGPAFVAGWLVGVLGVAGAVLVLSGGADASEGGKPADWASILKLVVGVLLVGVAARQWRGRPRGDEEPEIPGWMRKVDTFSAPRSAALALALAAVNPKNLLLGVGAATAIAQTGAATGDQVVALAVYAVIATAGVAVPVILYLTLGDRSRELLDRLKARMSSNNAAIMAVICLVIAAKLIGDAISGLSA